MYFLGGEKLSKNICPWRNNDKYWVPADQGDHVHKREQCSITGLCPNQPATTFTFCGDIYQYLMISDICNSDLFCLLQSLVKLYML